MPTTYSEPHEWECPGCHKAQEVSDYFEMHEGSEFECQHCERTSEIIETDYTVYWTTRLKP